MKGFGAKTADIHNLDPATVTLNARIKMHVIRASKGQLKKWFPSCKAVFQATCSTLTCHMREMLLPGSHFFAKNLAFSKCPEQWWYSPVKHEIGATSKVTPDFQLGKLESINTSVYLTEHNYYILLRFNSQNLNEHHHSVLFWAMIQAHPGTVDFWRLAVNHIFTICSSFRLQASSWFPFLV